MVTLRNPMYGAIALLVTFLAVAALFLLRHAEFLAVVQIFVYGGGIMVLFLFVIMLVNLHRLRETQLFWGAVAAGAGAGGAPGRLLRLALRGGAVRPAVPAARGLRPRSRARCMGNSQAVAWSLYRDYLLPFEIASVFLLVAMIGAVVLGRRE